MNKMALERVSPESVGVSSRVLLEMVRQLEQCGTEMHGIMVARHGKVILEGWWTPYSPQTIHICHSFGKSYVATAVGAACTAVIVRRWLTLLRALTSSASRSGSAKGMASTTSAISRPGRSLS